jgi:leucyl/phenylalanyl-tRNA--protein transferase
MQACASVPRGEDEGTWITDHMLRVYSRLHADGVAHSVETYRRDGGELVGGLYGLAVGRIFFGESMFSRQSDASKIAFWDLCVRLAHAGYHVVDCQAETAHLRSLGAQPSSRSAYLEKLAAAWDCPDGWTEAMRGPGLWPTAPR